MLAVIAICVISGLMATGAIEGYVGPWIWTLFALSLALFVVELYSDQEQEHP